MMAVKVEKFVSPEKEIEPEEEKEIIKLKKKKKI